MPYESKLSFQPFIQYLKKRVAEEQTIKAEFLKFILQKFESYPELQHPVEPEDIHKYDELLQLIYAALVPAVKPESENIFALGVPFSPVVFYSTNAFQGLLKEAIAKDLANAANSAHETEASRVKLEYVYSFILKKLYKNSINLVPKDVYALHDKKTGLTRYYHITIDTNFIDVEYACSLPPLEACTLQYDPEENRTEELDYLTEHLPLKNVVFKGFTVLSFVETTEQQAVENIKETILTRQSSDHSSYFEKVAGSLKSLVRSADIEFGILPLFRINDRLVFDNNSLFNSILLQTGRQQNVSSILYKTLAESYIHHPKLLFFQDISKEDLEDKLYLRLIHEIGVRSYALAPVFNNQQLVGVIEMYSYKTNMLTTRLVHALDPAMPLLAQLLQSFTNEFNRRIEDIIRDQFTSLQPAVQWKFNEVAWEYLQNSDLKDGSVKAKVLFEDLYPFYGAVDIKNSTVERNLARRSDHHIHFDLLAETLNLIREKTSPLILEEMIHKADRWMRKIDDTSHDYSDVRLESFLENEVHPFLKHIRNSYPAFTDAIEHYFKELDENTGSIFRHRRSLEASMQLINKTVSRHIDNFRNQLQLTYPCYFEKFRTDGIEYDIYTGQSIAPQRPFSPVYLKEIKLWQLRVMATVAKAMHQMQPQMPVPLQTTQLIFIYSTPVDISFRNDERRFDVEGSYNIRYQVIKKRIDKVHLRDSEERLTQPGKIALVYFHSSDADEYEGYIRFLQEQDLLLDDLEFLELEELQGVTGLKAMRVSVNTANETPALPAKTAANGS